MDMELQQQHEPLDLAISCGKKAKKEEEQWQYGSYDGKFKVQRTKAKAEPAEAEPSVQPSGKDDRVRWFTGAERGEDPDGDWLPAGKRWRFKVPSVEAYLKTLPFKKRICLMVKMAEDDYP